MFFRPSSPSPSTVSYKSGTYENEEKFLKSFNLTPFWTDSFENITKEQQSKVNSTQNKKYSNYELPEIENIVNAEIENSHESASNEEDDVIMSIFNRGEKLGAAFYDVENATLHTISDKIDPNYGDKSYGLLKKLVRQINPAHLIVSANQSKDVLEVLHQLCGVQTSSETCNEELLRQEEDAKNAMENVDNDSLNITGCFDIEIDDSSLHLTGGLQMKADDQNQNFCENDKNSSIITKDQALRNTRLHVLGSKEFFHETCVRRLEEQHLPRESNQSMNEEQTDECADSHYIFMHSLIDFSSECMVRAAGALLKFLDKFQIGGPNLDAPGSQYPRSLVLSIRPYNPEDTVAIDETTLTALQIFKSSTHPSGSKSGSWNKRKEGLSLFNILNRCCSIAGSKRMKSLFRALPRSICLIQERQEAVVFFSHPSQIDLVHSIKECLKNIKSVPKILKKLSSNQASVRDWKTLKTTMNYIIALGELCHKHSQKTTKYEIKIMSSLSNLVTSQLYSVKHYIERIFDSELSEEKQRFTVNAGFDENLDEKKRFHNGLPDFMYHIAQEEVEKLPHFMSGCTMVYVPQIGYLLSVMPWADDLERNKDAVTTIPGMEFMFFSNGTPHFKNEKCRELDYTIGDTVSLITEQETEIMIKLSNCILQSSEQLIEFCHHAATLDCLISFAVVAIENGWVRPNIIPSGSMKIVDGRHPLQELCVNTFVPNSTIMAQQVSNASQKESPLLNHIKKDKMMILTGPNACGKSVYLKQVGLIVFMAQLGSWVPAESAIIPIFDAIFTRIQTLESLELGMSAFMVDVNQISLAIRTSTSTSLILIDEFGKGTKEIDGLSLLAASLEHWLTIQNSENCPFVIVSTHFKNIKSILPKNNPLLKYQTFAFQNHGNDLVYLYRMIEGVSCSSYAHHVARKAGIDEEILSRSTNVLRYLLEGTPPLFALGTDEMNEIGAHEIPCDKFLNIEFEESDCMEENEMKKLFHILLNDVPSL